jgi:hypothetical protein
MQLIYVFEYVRVSNLLFRYVCVVMLYVRRVL